MKIPTAEAAIRLGLTRSRVQQLIREGQLPAEKIDGFWYVSAAAVAAYRPKPSGWTKGKPRAKIRKG